MFEPTRPLERERLRLAIDGGVVAEVAGGEVEEGGLGEDVGVDEAWP